MYRGTLSDEERRASRRVERRIRTSPKPFCGVDGEGGNIAGSHEYLLLRAGEHVLETGCPLGSYECFDFLSQLPPTHTYVSYYFDYDVTMMVRDLSGERIRKLLDRSARTIVGRGQPMGLDVGRYQIDYMPHKEFRVRRRIDGKKRAYTKWVTVSDVGTFFQCSFVAALRRWFGHVDRVDGRDVWRPNAGETHMEEVIERIAIGKEQRNSFGRVTEDERQYNHLEIKALESLMGKFRAMCGHVDLNPGKWQGPGNLVLAQFRKVGLPRNDDYSVFRDVPDLLRMANDGYYGGRFEAAIFGEVS